MRPLFLFIKSIAVLRMKFFLGVVFLLFPTVLFSQYPDMYIQYRSIPNGNPDWNKALTSYADGNLDSALIFVESAENTFIDTNDWESCLFIGNFKARILGEMRQPRKALDVLYRMRKDAALKIDTLSSMEYAENIFLTGRVYSLVNDYKSCEHFFVRAAHLLEQSGMYPEALAVAYYTLMQLNNLLMKDDSDQMYYMKAISTLKDIKTEYAKALYFFIQAEGIYDVHPGLKADFYKAAVKIFEKSGSINDFNYYNSLLKLIAQHSSTQPEYETALEYCRKAEHYAQTNRLSGAKVYGLYLAIGNMHLVFHEYEKSHSYFASAKKLIEKVFGGQSFEFILVNLYIGRAYRLMNDYDNAVKSYYLCQDIGTKGWKGRFPHEFSLYDELVKLYSKAGQPDSVLLYSHKRLYYDYKGGMPDIDQIPPIPDSKNIISYYKSLIYKVKAYRDMYNETGDTLLLSPALNHCSHAMRVLETVNEKSIEESSGIKNSGRIETLSSLAAYFLLEKYKHSGDDSYLYSAVTYIENSKANYLKLQVKERYYTQGDAHADDLKKKLSAFERQVESQLLSPDIDMQLVDSILMIKSRLLEQSLSSNGAQINNVERVEIPVYNLDSIRHNISENSCIVIYKVIDIGNDDDDSPVKNEGTIRNRQLLSFYLDRKQLEMSAVNIDDSHIALMNRFNASLKTGNMSGFYSDGKGLYELLLKPFDQLLKEKKNIVVVTDAKLPNIPFECFSAFENGNMLCSNWAVSYHYSVGLWNRSRLHSDNQIPKSFFAVAPDYNVEVEIFFDENDNYRESRNVSLKSLPMAKNEVREIGQLFRKERIKDIKIEKDGVTKGAFKRNAGKYEIVHVASHGFADMGNYKNSGLYFSRVRGDTIANNNFLSLNEIYGLQTEANLVVLSACKTNIGNRIRGEGIMALPRGFIYAGVPNVIASLWKVHDEKTKELMVAFYKHLLEDKTSYAEALRRAKLDCIAKGYLPMDWAGFVLIGN